MEFADVLHDLALDTIEEANQRYLAQREWHSFASFTVVRQVTSEGGSTFRIKIEFEPDPVESLARAVARN